jgi:hypothetical protein
MGLGHEQDNPAIMEAFISDLDVLTADDVGGINNLYPESATELDPIVLSVGLPRAGDVLSGVSSVRGFAVALEQPVTVEVLLDGISQGVYQTDDPRGDVGAAYPDYPDSDSAGFSFVFNFGLLPAGAHNYTFRAKDRIGRTVEKTVHFSVARYQTPFVNDSNLVSLAPATVSKAGEDLLINGLEHDGSYYDVRLRWNWASQKFEPVEIILQPAP